MNKWVGHYLYNGGLNMNIKKHIVLVSCLVVFVNIIWFSSVEAYAESKVKSVYFYSNTCGSCMNIMEEINENKELLESDAFIMIDISKRENINLFFEFCDQYKIIKKERSVPILFVGNKVYVSEIEIIEAINTNQLLNNKENIKIKLDGRSDYKLEKKLVFYTYYQQDYWMVLTLVQ